MKKIIFIILTILCALGFIGCIVFITQLPELTKDYSYQQLLISRVAILVCGVCFGGLGAFSLQIIKEED